MEIKTRKSHNIIIYDIIGDITIREVTPVTLHQHVKSQLEEGERNFLLNFENIDFIDSYGVGELIASFISISDLEGKLKITKMSQKIRYLFEVTAMVRVFEIFDDEEEAIKSFSN